MDNQMNLLPHGGEMFVVSDFFSKEESDKYFEVLYNTIPWQLDKIRVFGELHDQPRLTAMFGDEGTHYKYSGIDMPAKLWTKELLEIKEK